MFNINQFIFASVCLTQTPLTAYPDWRGNKQIAQNKKRIPLWMFVEHDDTLQTTLNQFVDYPTVSTNEFDSQWQTVIIDQ